MIDLIRLNHNNQESPEIKCLDHGFVRLIDSMPRITYESNIKNCDFAVVQAARTSTGNGLKSEKEDRNLLRYLMRHRHTSPFEMVRFKFHCQMPIFVARQWIRHRMGSFNEFSGRYAEMPDLFYEPTEWRGQSQNNKQCSDGLVDYHQGFYDETHGDSRDLYISEICWNEYQRRLEAGVSKEMARMCLSVNIYTQWYWTTDLKNILDFLALRCDKHSQHEIQVYANAILDLIRPLVPETISAWEDYHPMRGGMLLTKHDIKTIQCCLEKDLVSEPSNYMSKREIEESYDKLKILGIL